MHFNHLYIAIAISCYYKSFLIAKSGTINIFPYFTNLYPTLKKQILT